MADRIAAMAKDLVGSEIIRIAADVRELRARGRDICNLTVGDFDPRQFPIPEFLRTGIIDAIREGETNYPPSDGVPELREAIGSYCAREVNLICDHHGADRSTILVTSGSRPGIFAAYSALVDPGDIALYPTPSWNNNHYAHLVGARALPVRCDASADFLPTRGVLESAMRGARLLTLNSPLNPAGTMFSADDLGEICDLVLEENARRQIGERPLYLLYDQVYQSLRMGDVPHVHPVVLRPEMAPFTITVDGISKAFAATGLRVGWAIGPADVIDRMSAIVAHVGAWAPRAEQIATARLLNAPAEIAEFHATMTQGIRNRLDALHLGLQRLQDRGFPLESIRPMGAIYLSARFALLGWSDSSGARLESDDDVRHYLLEAAGMAVVPFSAFGMEPGSGWFRLSVGAASVEEIDLAMKRLERALETLSPEARSGSRAPARQARRPHHRAPARLRRRK